MKSNDSQSVVLAVILGLGSPWAALLQAQNERKVHPEVEAAQDEVAAMDYDALCEALLRYDKAYEMAFTAGMHSMGSAFWTNVLMTRQVVGDLRAVKLAEILRQLPAADASAKAAELFDNTLDRYARVWKENPPSHVPRHPVGTHPVCVALFLCAHFCDADTVLHKATAWKEWYGEWYDGQVAMHGRKSGIYDPRPSWQFLLNCYLNVLERRGESRESLNSRLAALGEELDVELSQLFPCPVLNWNCRTRPLANADRQTVEAFSKQETLFETSALGHPDFRIYGNEELQDRILERAASWLRDAQR